MGITERKERQKAELRQRILEAARAIVLEDGLEGLTMRRVADAIEYSPATIYLHFPGRDEIAVELMQDAFEQLVNSFRPLAAIADPVERVVQIGLAYVRFGMENPETYRLIFMDAPQLSHEVICPEGSQADPFAFLTHTVEEMIATGRLEPGLRAEMLSQLLWAAMHGIVSLHFTVGDMPLEDPMQMAQAMCDMTMRGMLA